MPRGQRPGSLYPLLVRSFAVANMSLMGDPIFQADLLLAMRGKRLTKVAIVVAIVALAWQLWPEFTTRLLLHVAHAGICLIGALGHAARAVCLLATTMLTAMQSGPSVEGEVVTITGASSGIGAALAVQMAARKARLVLGARRGDALETVAALCRRAGAIHVSTVLYDAAIPDHAEKLVQHALETHGRLDVLVLNAGIGGQWANFSDLTGLENLERVMRVNYLGYVRATRAALPALMESKGKLMVVSSMYGHLAAPYQPGYSASKHAVQGFFDSLRPELARRGVSVSVHSPGGVATKVTEKFLSARSDPVALQAPAVFLAAPEACAASILYCLDHRLPQCFFPAYADLFAFVRMAWGTTIFDSAFYGLVETYFQHGIMALSAVDATT